MAHFLELLEEMGIHIEDEKIRIDEDHRFKTAHDFFEKAILDILEKKSSFYKDAVERGMQISIGIQVSKGSKIEFDLSKQVKHYMEDMK